MHRPRRKAPTVPSTPPTAPPLPALADLRRDAPRTRPRAQGSALHPADSDGRGATVIGITDSSRRLRRPLSARCAGAALVVYLAAGLTLVAPPATPWVLAVLAGTGLLAAGLRTGRPTLVGLALVVAVGARVGRAAILDRVAPGGSAGVLALALALLAVGELARLAIDAGARPGAVRIAPEVGRRLRLDALLTAGLAVAATATVVVVAAPDWDRPSQVFLPLGVLALPALLAALTWLGRPERRRLDDRPELRRSDERIGRHPDEFRRRRPAVAPGRRRPGDAAGRRRPGRIAAVVVVAALALPLLAGLAARSPGPLGDGGPPLDEVTEQAPPENPTDVEPVPLDRQPAEDRREPPSPPLGVLVAAGVVALVLALLLGGGEGLVSADDRRPDTAPAEEPLRGAAAAPVVQALPPEEVAAIVDDALGYLRAELEPRLAVRCAYAAVAGGLGRHELARLPAETELEFLARQLQHPGVGRATGSGQAVTGQAVNGGQRPGGQAASGGRAAGSGQAVNGGQRPGGQAASGQVASGQAVNGGRVAGGGRALDESQAASGGQAVGGGPTIGQPGGGADDVAAVRAGALARLTDLFELARFSDRPVDDTMRAEALAALEEVRRNLGVGVSPPAVPRRPPVDVDSRRRPPGTGHPGSGGAA